MTASKDQVWILSIDGGGIRGLIPAIILAEIEKQVSDKLDKVIRIADIFDMVAGTSTGSIISLGLTVPVDKHGNLRPASKLVKLYEEKGKDIFSKISFWDLVKAIAKKWLPEEKGKDIFSQISFWNLVAIAKKWLHFGSDKDFESYWILGPDFNPEPLEKLLLDEFKGKKLQDAVVNVLIPAYNMTETKEVYFTNDPSSYNGEITNVIRASTAAPNSFPAKKIEKSHYIDGGVFNEQSSF